MCLVTYEMRVNRLFMFSGRLLVNSEVLWGVQGYTWIFDLTGMGTQAPSLFKDPPYFIGRANAGFVGASGRLPPASWPYGARLPASLRSAGRASRWSPEQVL